MRITDFNIENHANPQTKSPFWIDSFTVWVFHHTLVVQIFQDFANLLCWMNSVCKQMLQTSFSFLSSPNPWKPKCKIYIFIFIQFGKREFRRLPWSLIPPWKTFFFYERLLITSRCRVFLVLREVSMYGLCSWAYINMCMFNISR